MMREQEITQRIKFFLKDFVASIRPLERADDKIKFIKSLQELLVGVFKGEEEAFDEDQYIEEHFLSPFRNRMKSFVDLNLHYYFAPDPSYQEIISAKMSLDPPVIFDQEEMMEYVLRIYSALDIMKTNLYLTETEKGGEKLEELAGQRAEESVKANLKIKNNEFTRSRQALAIYYLFKSLGLNPRIDVPMVNLAKLAHLLSGMPYEEINNSSIYRVMKDLPSLKNEKNLLDDLEFVKKHFELVNLKEAVVILANTQWKTTGNTAQSTDFVGTTNQQPLIFKTNNTEAMRVDPTGKIIFSKLTSTNGDGVVIIGGGGEGGRIDFTHNFTHVLNGQGIFTDISTFTGLTVSGNNIIQTTSGNIGFGVSNPTAKISVAGGGNFTGNLNIGGNILSNAVTTNTLSAGTLTAGNLSSTSLSTGAISASTLDLNQTLSFGGGQARIGFTAAGSNNNNINVLAFGNNGNQRISPTNVCFFPVQNQWLTQFPDAIQIYNQYSFSSNNQNLLSIGYDGLNNFIDAAGINSNGGPSLLINYFCGKDVSICTGSGNSPNNGGTAGGFVFTGPNVQIGGANPTRDASVALNIGSKGSTAIKMQDNNGNINFLLGSDGTVSFGRDQNGICRVPAGYQMAVFGKIITKEVVVKLEPWPDYVFTTNYQLKDLFEVEKFIKQNQHLPNIPSAKEISDNGVQLGEMVGKQMEKIEELTLYMIEMKKEIETLKKENNVLKASLKK